MIVDFDRAIDLQRLVGEQQRIARVIDYYRIRFTQTFPRSEHHLAGSAGQRGIIKPNLPSVEGLSKALWPIGFPDDAFDNRSTLGDIYDVAVKRAGNRVKDTLRTLLTVDSTGIPEVYRKWFSMPWARIYTLNIDDLDEAVQNAFNLPRRIRSISAQSDSYPVETTDLFSIHLNGKVEEYPSVTFSPRQYAERSARHDPWYYHLVADLMSHPILFVGTELDEPLLWQHIELRGRRGARQKELRPGSYLVEFPQRDRAKCTRMPYTFKLCSKYIHPSSWLLVDLDDRFRSEMNRKNLADRFAIYGRTRLPPSLRSL